MSFAQAMTFTLRAEGAYTQIDGGTMCGVTQAVYDDYRNTYRLPDQTVALITMDEVRSIMDSRYWQPAGCGSLSPRMGIAHFDWAFNHGVSGAVKTLQGVLGIRTDGVMGAVSIATAQASDQDRLLSSYLAARRAWYLSDTAQSKYLAGWLNRVDALEKYLWTL